MKPKMYSILNNAVEIGVNYGWNRAHKYTDTPEAETIKNEMMIAIMHEICEWFSFDETE